MWKQNGENDTMKSFLNCPFQCDQMKEGTKDGKRSTRVKQGDNLRDLGVEVWLKSY